MGVGSASGSPSGSEGSGAGGRTCSREGCGMTEAYVVWGHRVGDDRLCRLELSVDEEGRVGLSADPAEEEPEEEAGAGE